MTFRKYTFIWDTISESTYTSCFGINAGAWHKPQANTSSQSHGCVCTGPDKMAGTRTLYYPLSKARLYTPAGPDRLHNHMQTNHKMVHRPCTMFALSLITFSPIHRWWRMLAKTKAVDLRLSHAGQCRTSCIQPLEVCSTKQKEGSLHDKDRRVCNVPWPLKYTHGTQDTFTSNFFTHALENKCGLCVDI